MLQVHRAVDSPNADMTDPQFWPESGHSLHQPRTTAVRKKGKNSIALSGAIQTARKLN
jgi:hypothetical protein